MKLFVLKVYFSQHINIDDNQVCLSLSQFMNLPFFRSFFELKLYVALCVNLLNIFIKSSVLNSNYTTVSPTKSYSHDFRMSKTEIYKYAVVKQRGDDMYFWVYQCSHGVLSYDYNNVVLVLLSGDIFRYVEAIDSCVRVPPKSRMFICLSTVGSTFCRTKNKYQIKHNVNGKEKLLKRRNCICGN